MLPHTHAYAAREITGRDAPLLIYGSMLPDLPATCSGLFEYYEIDEGALAFREWLRQKEPASADLALGAMLHERHCGIDRLNHGQKKDGWAYALSEQHLAADVARAYGMDGLTGKVLGHGFIESGVAFHLTHAHPEIIDLVHATVDGVDLEQVAKHLAAFYGQRRDKPLEAGAVLADLQDFSQGKLRRDLRKMDDHIATWEYVIQRHWKIDTSSMRPVTHGFVERSIDLVEPLYEDFLSATIAACKANLRVFS